VNFSEQRDSSRVAAGTASRGIALEHLSFSYGKTAVFENLNLSVSARLLVLRGPSGCGKTTLLKLCAGILHPSTGSVHLDHTKPVFICQEDALFPWLTGWQNIRNVAKVSTEQIEQSPLFERINGFLHQRASEMSFGQRRLVEIARALLVRPDMLCLDEPFNFIDPATRALIQELLIHPPANLKDATILVSSHYDTDFSKPGIATISFDGELPVNKLALSIKQ
jgi:NitT/TauT family transport system ATP-binding protein